MVKNAFEIAASALLIFQFAVLWLLGGYNPYPMTPQEHSITIAAHCLFGTIMAVITALAIRTDYADSVIRREIRMILSFCSAVISALSVWLLSSWWLAPVGAIQLVVVILFEMITRGRLPVSPLEETGE